MKIKKFPKEVFVCIEGDPPDQFLGAYETAIGIENGTAVGIYKLVAVKKQKVIEELV